MGAPAYQRRRRALFRPPAAPLPIRPASRRGWTARAAMVALAALCAVGLGLGIYDFTLPLAMGDTIFASLHAPTNEAELRALAVRAFVHNWGVALVVPIIGGLAVHYEPRAKLVAGILVASVLVGSVSGFAVLPPPNVGLREYILLPLEILGVLAGAVLGGLFVARGERGGNLEETCRRQLRGNRLAIALSGIVLLWASTYEAWLLAPWV